MSGNFTSKFQSFNLNQKWTFFCISALFFAFVHGLRTPVEEIAFSARPKINSHFQIFRYGRSIRILSATSAQIFRFLWFRYACIGCPKFFWFDPFQRARAEIIIKKIARFWFKWKLALKFDSSKLNNFWVLIHLEIQIHCLPNKVTKYLMYIPFLDLLLFELHFDLIQWWSANHW